MKFKIAPWLICILVLAACGKGDQPAAEPEEAATTPPPRNEQPARPAESQDQAVSGKCGQGGSECPAGLECVTFRGGLQSCGPVSVAAAVLIKDTTLGGGCLSPNPADPLPGASIASVHVVGNDGNVSGYGRLVWDQAGFEVATERGTPPDASEFTGDACSNYFNLGCDGQAVFEIVDDGGEIQKLREGQTVVAQLRGQETCGEEVADEIEAAICNDPAAAASGKLESCTSRVRMVEVPSDVYGPDRVGGTIQYLSVE